MTYFSKLAEPQPLIPRAELTSMRPVHLRYESLN